MILCAGRGSRLYPLTHLLPKALVPIGEKPLIVHNLEKLAAAGIREIGLVVGQNKERFFQLLGDGKSFGFKLTYLIQEKPLGLAHALLVGKDYVQHLPHFLVILGDNFFGSDFKQFIDAYLASGAESQLMLAKVENPTNFGVASLAGNRIVKLVEKPKKPESHWAVAGLYAFTPRIFQEIDRLQPSSRGELELTDAVAGQIKNGYFVKGYFTANYWYDVGSVAGLLQANKQYLSQLPDKVEGKISDNCLISGIVVAAKGCRLNHCILEGPVLIQEDSLVENCRLGPNVVIGKRVKLDNCKLRNTIILEGSRLSGVEGVIKDSLIGPNCIVKGNKGEEKILILGADANLSI